MQESGKSPLARLVLFMICLAIAGSFVAGLYCYAAGFPLKNPALMPRNSGDNSCEDYKQWLGGCYQECSDKYTDKKYSPIEAIAYHFCLDWCNNYPHESKKYC